MHMFAEGQIQQLAKSDRQVCLAVQFVAVGCVMES